MSTSSTKKIEIKPYAFYSFNTDLAKGLGIILFEVEEEYSYGVKIVPGSVENYKEKTKTIENFIIYETISFVEQLPKYVWKFYKKFYKKIS